jgi:hypothetical protein
MIGARWMVRRPKLCRPGPHVLQRFADGLQTLIKMPLGGFGPRWFGGCWPAYRIEWDDLVAVYGDAEARDQFYEVRNTVRTRPSAQEISQMERSLSWPSAYLRGSDPDMCRAFNLVGLATAREVSVDDVARHGRRTNVKSPTEWHRIAIDAASEIAAGLRVDKVAVF